MCIGAAVKTRHQYCSDPITNQYVANLAIFLLELYMTSENVVPIYPTTSSQDIQALLKESSEKFCIHTKPSYILSSS